MRNVYRAAVMASASGGLVVFLAGIALARDTTWGCPTC